MAQASTQSANASNASASQGVLRARGVKKTYQMGDAQIAVLKNVDLTLHPGEFVAIEGRSGSGKSTLLHILGGLDSPDGGTLDFDGKDYTPTLPTERSNGPTLRWPLTATTTESIFVGLVIFAALTGIELLASQPGPPRLLLTDLGLKEIVGLFAAVSIASAYFGFKKYLAEQPICDLRNRRFGFVFQFYHLLPELNVLENTLLSAMIEKSWWGYRLNKPDLLERATKLLTELGMDHRLKHKPNQLSGGERQRVAIARALMNSPKVLFADEPTGNLDYETGRQIMAVLEKLHQEKGQTIVMVTHDRSLASQADRVLVLRNGKLEKPGESAGADKAGVLDYR